MEHIKIKKARKSLIYTLLEVFGKPFGGERGIRTPDTCYGTPDFESGAFNHSAISPVDYTAKVITAPLFFQTGFRLVQELVAVQFSQINNGLFAIAAT
jgi:hypothetical protein